MNKKECGGIAIQEADDELLGKFVVVRTGDISVDDVVRIGRFLGCIEEKR